MRNFILFLAILCAAGSFMFFTAAKEAPDGSDWASSVCSSARMWCHDPYQLTYAAAGLAALWAIMSFVSAIRG